MMGIVDFCSYFVVNISKISGYNVMDVVLVSMKFLVDWFSDVFNLFG